MLDPIAGETVVPRRKQPWPSQARQRPSASKVRHRIRKNDTCVESRLANEQLRGLRYSKLNTCNTYNSKIYKITKFTKFPKIKIMDYTIYTNYKTKNCFVFRFFRFFVCFESVLFFGCFLKKLCV